MARKSSVRWIAGGAVIATAIVGISFLNLGENLVYFYTPAEALAKSQDLTGQNIKVGGMIKPGSVVWQPEQLSLTFTVTDPDNNEILVKHKGTPPDMFKEGQGVVVEGRFDDSGRTMISRTLMVKHSEEYKKPDSHATMDKALLEKSIFKD